MELWATLAVAAVPLPVAGCSTDLGSCDADQVEAVVFEPSGQPYFAGQFITQQSCAGGFCHAANASGAARLGAPAGLNFGVAPVVEGSDIVEETRRLRNARLDVREHAASMFEQVDRGWMPPDGVGQDFSGPHEACTDDAFLLETLDEGDPVTCAPLGLTTVVFDLRDGRTREVLRNWLACGGPLVERCVGVGNAPNFLGEELECRSSVTPTFASIWQTVLSANQCTGCHAPEAPGNFFESGGELDLSDRTAAYDGLLSPAAGRGTDCSVVGQNDLVIPGEDPEDGVFESLLIEKLRGTQTCGDPMPLAGSPVPTSVIEVIEDWIRMGAANDG